MVTTAPYTDLRRSAVARVYVREAWGDDWTELRAGNIQTTKSLESIGIARFVTSFGMIMKQGDTDFSIQGPQMQQHIGWWVKIEGTAEAGKYNSVADPLLADKDVAGEPIPDPDSPGDYIQTIPYRWYGIVTDVAPQYRGTSIQPVQNPGALKVPAEDSAVTCHAIEWMLSRQQVAKSFVDDGGPGKEIQRGLGFNAWRSDTTGGKFTVGNKSDLFNEFSEDLSNADLWTSKNAITYLLDRFAPTNQSPGAGPDWTLESSTILDWLTPVVRTHGRTVFQILNDLIPKNRGVTWSAEMDETSDEITVRIHSYLAADVTLPSGAIIPKNDSLIELDLLEQHHVNVASRVVNQQTVYNQVVVQGARAGRVFTVRVGNELEKAWATALETTYEDASVASPGYGALEFAEKARLNDSTRMSETLRGVYTTFQIVAGWDGVANGVNVLTMDGVFPTAEWWEPGLRFGRTLPLIEGHDYSTNPLSPANTGLREYQKPFATIEIRGTGWHERVDNLSSHTLDEVNGGDGMACYVRMQRERAGIDIRPTGAPHFIGANHFNFGGAEPTDQVPFHDYSTIDATVYMQGDDYCEGKWPAAPTAPIHDEEAILYISVGERARLDWLAAGTVLDLKDNTKITAATSGFIRDDRQYCEDIARSAWEVYGSPKNAIQYSLNMVSTHVDRGELVTDFVEGEVTLVVDSIVSSVSIDWESGRTDVRTQFVELDRRGVFG